MFELKTCPTCGSTDLTQIGTEEHDGLSFAKYRCAGCDSTPSAYTKFKKKKAAEAKNAPAAAPQAAPPEAPKPLGGAAVVYKKNISCVVTVESRLESGSKCGTGIIVSPKGYMLTNAHVVTELDSAHGSILELCDDVGGSYGESNYHFGSEFVYADPVLDLALLKIDTEAQTAAVDFATIGIETGESVFAIGNSKGEGLCIVEGIVSDAHRSMNGNEYIMITAPVVGGNSGGPVFNNAGQLVGIVCCGHPGVATMNYALPTETIRAFLSKACESEGIEL